MTDIKENLKKVGERVARAARKVNRCPRSIRVMAVTKRHSIDAIQSAAAAGQRDFGENFLQEAAEKIENLQDSGLVWHFIGRIQSNKTRSIAQLFDWVHTVDRLKIAQRLSEQRPEDHPRLNICLQVNVASDQVKGGVSPEHVSELVEEVRSLPKLRLRGLMCIPPQSDVLDEQRGYFARVRSLFTELASDQKDWDTLSMGMSGDLESAVFEGSTFVRIGTAIFGPRT
ncbi:MAG: YggS family pyridoxal phosphate-dependent enzyme [Pseudomonadota bacterium]